MTRRQRIRIPLKRRAHGLRVTYLPLFCFFGTLLVVAVIWPRPEQNSESQSADVLSRREQHGSLATRNVVGTFSSIKDCGGIQRMLQASRIEDGSQPPIRRSMRDGRQPR